MKIKLLLLSSFFYLLSFAQEVPKNILVEHYTNTYCGICASRNPTFYNTIDNYEKVVHIAYHPSLPYASCPFSQHNMSENDARTNFYGIYGSTPRVVVNGNVVAPSVNLITNATLDAQNNLTTPFNILVEQFQVGNDSMYSQITIQTVSMTSVSSAIVYLALSEQTLNFAAQNGEGVHKDVFRKFLGTSSGITLTLPTNGNDTTFTLGSIIDQEWNPSELTTTVVLQESDQNVLQAEQSEKLSFTTAIVSLDKLIQKAIYPNPAKDFIYINNEQLVIEKIEFYNILGSLIHQELMGERKDAKLSVSNFDEGNYIIRVYDKNKEIYTRKIVVDY